MSATDKIKNAAQDLAGKAKEAAGSAKGDEDLKAEGQVDQSAASAKKAGENVKDIFKN
ncbi:MAG: CsbD family protein [Janthinobacterium lividum]